MSPNTRQLLRYAACLPLAATSVAHAAQPASVWQQQALAWTFHHENVLGTSMEVTLRAGDHRVAEQAEAALLAVIDRENLMLSAWNRASELNHWLASNGGATRVSGQLLEVLGLFDHWREVTGGALNASAETAVRLWQQATAELRQPTQAELARAVAAMEQMHWRVDAAEGTATRLTDAPLALASFTKSYIADHAADAALSAGARGVMLNIGGDVVVRGDLARIVDIADPMASAENDAPMDRLLVRGRAVATSGSYRRGFNLTGSGKPEFSHIPQFSHIIDPRTAMPAGHVLSSTVIARDPSTAGALATAFSVMSVDESRELAAKTSGVDYMLLTRAGERIASEGWGAYQAPLLRNASYSSPLAARSAPRTGAAAGAASSAWNQGYELEISLEVARINDFRSHRPYVAVWVENEDHTPVRTIALWFGKMRYLDELHSWYRTEQRAGNVEGVIRTVSSATRSPGKYTLKWDGKDDAGKLVNAGKYTICIEAAREHGTYQIIRQEMDFNGKPQQVALPGGTEIGAAALDYHKR